MVGYNTPDTAERDTQRKQVKKKNISNDYGLRGALTAMTLLLGAA